VDPLTVLCIDDRPQVLALRKAALESHNCCVKIASSGYTAMKILEETSVAVVLLEYKLEGMDAEAVAYATARWLAVGRTAGGALRKS